MWRCWPQISCQSRCAPAISRTCALANLRQMYSEELITSCLSTAKNLLDKVIYPFVEANSDVHGSFPFLAALLS